MRTRRQSSNTLKQFFFKLYMTTNPEELLGSLRRAGAETGPSSFFSKY